MKSPVWSSVCKESRSKMKGSKDEPRKFVETSSLMACRQTEGYKQSG